MFIIMFFDGRGEKRLYVNTLSVRTHTGIVYGIAQNQSIIMLKQGRIRQMISNRVIKITQNYYFLQRDYAAECETKWQRWMGVFLGPREGRNC